MADSYLRWKGEWIPLDVAPDVDPGVIDNFEYAPTGVYEHGDGLEAFYTQPHGSDEWTINDEDPVIEGDRSAKPAVDNPSWNVFVSEPGDGLNYYPQEGDIISGYLNGSGGQAQYGWYADPAGNSDGYAVMVGDGTSGAPTIEIRRWDDGSTTLLTDDNSVSVSAEFYEVETEIRTGGEYVCHLYDIDQSTGDRITPDTPLTTVSTTDTTYTGNSGFMIGNRSSTAEMPAIDAVWKSGEV